MNVNFRASESHTRSFSPDQSEKMQFSSLWLEMEPATLQIWRSDTSTDQQRPLSKDLSGHLNTDEGTDRDAYSNINSDDNTETTLIKYVPRTQIPNIPPGDL